MALKVIRRCVNRCGIYDFLLALRNNLTSICNRSLRFAPSLYIHTHLCLRWNWKKEAGSRWCQGAHDIGLSNHKLKSALKCIVWSQCTFVPDRQTDRRTNIMAIARRFVPTNASRANNGNYHHYHHHRRRHCRPYVCVCDRQTDRQTDGRTDGRPGGEQ